MGGAVVLATLLRLAGLDEALVSTYGLREGLALPVLHGPHLITDVRNAGLSGRFPDPSGRSAVAGEEAGIAFDHLAPPDGAPPSWRPILVGAVRVACSGGDPAHLYAEPIQGHTHAEILGMANLVGLAQGEVPPAVRRIFDAAVPERPPFQPSARRPRAR